MSENASKAKEFTSKANVVEGWPSRPPQNNKKHDPIGKGKFHNKNGLNPQIQKKRGNSFNFDFTIGQLIEWKATSTTKAQ